MRPARLNVLFLCSRNRWRSPTAEKIYRNDERVNVRSQGTARGAVKRPTSHDVAWADIVIVMEEKHRQRVLSEFLAPVRFKPIHVLDIPDLYQFMDLDLGQLIHSAADPIISRDLLGDQLIDDVTLRDVCDSL